VKQYLLDETMFVSSQVTKLHVSFEAQSNVAK